MRNTFISGLTGLKSLYHLLCDSFYHRNRDRVSALMLDLAIWYDDFEIIRESLKPKLPRAEPTNTDAVL